jgi:hypothetical protein
LFVRDGNLWSRLDGSFALMAKILAKLQEIINKLLSLIPGAAIRLIVKLGPITIIDETFTTADALAATIALTLCKK